MNRTGNTIGLGLGLGLKADTLFAINFLPSFTRSAADEPKRRRKENIKNIVRTRTERDKR